MTTRQKVWTATQVSGVVAVNQRLDARSSVSLNAVYSSYYYTGAGSGPDTPDFATKGINLSYQRVLSRSLSASVSVGPQWVSSSDSVLIPSALNVAVNAGLSYGYHNTHASVSYTRGVNNGSGVLPGALSDGVAGSVGQTFGRDSGCLAQRGLHTHTSGLTEISNGTSLLPTNEIFDTVYGGVQVTRRISTHFSGYASYTVQNQTSNNLNPITVPNALNGTSQTFGIGITFTPRSTNLGQF